MEKQAIHRRIRGHLTRFHRIRKVKEEDLPPWKEKWNNFNETQLQELEDFIDKMIPWLVLLLLFIILGEFSSMLNFFNWGWVDNVAVFFHHHADAIHTLDQVIIGFFIVDLYFNFFKKKTVWVFLKTSILDIIAVAPFGLLFEFAGLGEAQTVLHITTEAEKEAARILKEGEVAAKLARTEEAAKFLRVERGTRVARLFGRVGRALARLPRLFRLNRLTQFFKKK